MGFLNKDEKITIFLGVMIVTIYAFTIYTLIYNPTLHKNLLAESGVYETIGALATLGAAIIFFIIFWKYPRTLSIFPGNRNLFLAVLSFGLFFFFLEEISWGQRLFDMAIPEWFIDNNAQREINLHNYKAIYYMADSVGYEILQAYFVVLPMMVYALPTIKKWCKHVSLPLPDIQVALLFLIGQILFRDLYLPLINFLGLRGEMNYAETYEFVAELLILLFSFRYLLSIRKHEI